MDEKTIPFSKLPVDVRVQLSGGKKSPRLNLDYRALFEQTGECVFIIGQDLKLITANQQALLLLGYEESQLMGLPVEDIMLMDDSDQQDTLFERHLSVSESTLRRKNGTLLPVELSISVVHNDQGLPTHIQMLARDITEQARLDQMKSDFINRASHELRTPLTSAIMMVELLQQGGTKEETDEYLGVLEVELNRQKDLINQLLLAGRLENGGMKLEAVSMNLMQVLQDSILAMKVIAGKRNIQLEIHADEESITILGDKSGLSQVFINLINNAVKFSPEGRAVSITVNREAEYASVAITDHGLGIPADALPHLFERFYRAKNITVAEIPGSGIGLYIVKSIIDELGGMISVESEINHGTTFTVKLRLTK